MSTIYLINSQEKEFDRESLKAFKSLKAYKYFEDGLVTNVSVVELSFQLRKMTRKLLL